MPETFSMAGKSCCSRNRSCASRVSQTSVTVHFPSTSPAQWKISPSGGLLAMSSSAPTASYVFVPTPSGKSVVLIATAIARSCCVLGSGLTALSRFDGAYSLTSSTHQSSSCVPGGVTSFYASRYRRSAGGGQRAVPRQGPVRGLLARQPAAPRRRAAGAVADRARHAGSALEELPG